MLSKRQRRASYFLLLLYVSSFTPDREYGSLPRPLLPVYDRRLGRQSATPPPFLQAITHPAPLNRFAVIHRVSLPIVDHCPMKPHALLTFFAAVALTAVHDFFARLKFPTSLNGFACILAFDLRNQGIKVRRQRNETVAGKAMPNHGCLEQFKAVVASNLHPIGQPDLIRVRLNRLRGIRCSRLMQQYRDFVQQRALPSRVQPGLLSICVSRGDHDLLPSPG